MLNKLPQDNILRGGSLLSVVMKSEGKLEKVSMEQKLQMVNDMEDYKNYRKKKKFLRENLI